jgi:RND family efflux transporter MFP subunit
VVVVVGLALTAWLITKSTAADETDLVWYKVKYEPDLEKTIVERGTLEAKNNADVICRVKAGTKNSTVSTTIKQLLVEDGDKVTKDQLLIELDSSGLEDQQKTQSITRDNARLAYEQAEGDLIIQRSKNDSDLALADTTLELAVIDLKKYLEADYPAKLDDINNQLEQARDRVAYSDRMVKKEFMSQSQAQADQFALRKVEHQVDVLKLEYKRFVTQYTRALDEAKKNKQRVLEQTKTNEKTALTKVQTTKKVYEQEQARLNDIENEIKKCKIYAPQDGMVVYVVPEQARWGGGTQQSIVAQGEPVREGQKLMKIPDLSKMQVSVKIHEALVSSVRIGQSALIKVDAFPGKVFHGHVESVATVESKQDFMTADVKTYPTVISVQTKDMVQGLKPGMSAAVTVQLNRVKKPVLTVPVEAVLDPLERGKKPTIVVKNAAGEIEEREVETGLNNERMVEIRSGLKEGERVVVNPSKWAKARNHGKASSLGGRKDGEFGPPREAPKDAPRGPNGKPDAKKGAAKGGPPRAGGMMPSPQQQQEFLEKMRNASPAERKQMLQRIPADYREQAKQGFKAAGIEIPD